MNRLLLVPIFLPTLAGLVCLVIPKRVKWLREILALASVAATLAVSVYIFIVGNLRFSLLWLSMGPALTVPLDFLAGPFASLVLVAASFFAFLLTLYSLKYMADHSRRREHYAYLLLALGMTAGAALANNLIVLLLFWDILVVVLYGMVSLGGEKAIEGANKSLLVIGAADLALLMGIVLLWKASGTITLSDLTAKPLPLSGWLAVTAYVLILAGAFAKAGAMPLHSWLPAISTSAPIPTLAYLPAALDKLLGIYLLARISLNLFVMTPVMGLILMALGSISIVAALLMALIQHDFRRMLAFHAVSQVGYMVLGIGTGVPIGVIGGLFHMLNNALYKCCLFLCGGSVEHQTGRTEFSQLGGLAGAMPWTFAACLVAALSISGVPPFNGFVSKWLIYQGILDRGGPLFPLFLIAAMFGSALTLASFMKLLYSLFWGDRPKGLEGVHESSASMIIPVTVLALLCLGFGVFYAWPVNVLIRPILGPAGQLAVIPGIWQSGLATFLLIVSLLAGFVFYLLGRPRETKQVEVFLGGEVLDPGVYRVPGTQFYSPIRRLGALKPLYERGEQGAFDLYGYMVRSLTWVSEVLYRFIDQALGRLYRQVLPDLLDRIGQIVRVLNSGMILTLALWVAYAAGFLVSWRLPAQADLLTAARVLACVGMFGWGLLALIEIDLRRLLVMAVSSQMGFVLLGATLSWTAALVHLLAAAVGFAALFLCCGSIRRTRKTSEIDELDGLAGEMPGRVLVFLIAALWLSGLPPFGSFFSKYLIGIAAEQISPWYSVTIAAAAILTLGYLLRPLRSFLHSGD
ncbi:MAG: proton-conducting transporter membrane subunit [Anaerolineales bacterium]|jgi:formate hydrogenlyase subunit 3/multisubunit Na+/H+ antiporter MnhD subunit